MYMGVAGGTIPLIPKFGTKLKWLASNSGHITARIKPLAPTGLVAV